MANRSSDKTAIPEAKGAMDRFKFEVAVSELDIPLADGYNGNLTSRQNGSETEVTKDVLSAEFRKLYSDPPESERKLLLFFHIYQIFLMRLCTPAVVACNSHLLLCYPHNGVMYARKLERMHRIFHLMRRIRQRGEFN